jgi:peptidoglycan/LPS O-acetylase OafA/YrhL
MFGTFRFALALMVVVTHVGGIEVVAGIAVWGFFMLSGFLMTGVLNCKYGFRASGLRAFTTSRAIRLLPTYWLMLAATAILATHFGAQLDARQINEALVFPDTVREMLANLFIVGHTVLGIGRIALALSPSAWAIDVEILMYACSCIFLARSERVARTSALLLMLVFPLLWVGAKLVMRQGFIEIGNQLTYSFLPAALLPYAIGSWVWFVRDRLPLRWCSATVAALAVAATLACILVVSRYSVTAAYVLTLPCLAVIILRLSRLRGAGLVARIDDLLGRMSYPIYLSHWMCAYVVVLAAPAAAGLHHSAGGHIVFTSTGFIAVVAAVLLVSLLTAVAVEGPIEKIRHAAAAHVARRPLKLRPVEEDIA